MAVLEHLEPKRVFGFFEEICAIPHGSGHTAAISAWLVKFGEDRGLEVHQDKMGNVVLVGKATPGYEDAAPVILQGHMDMVCEKALDCTKDMEKEGLDLAIDGDVVYAKGTTLGGDDGIAVAMGLAILDDPDIPHPEVELLVTVDEEIGLLGAAGLDMSVLKGRRLINIDSEDEGILTVSCAGGNDTACVLPVIRDPWDAPVYTVTVGGLLGGHSGAEINKGRGNSNILMGRVLYAASRAAGLRVIEVRGGLKDNAIPRETVALVAAADGDALKAVCANLDADLKDEYRVTDPDVFVSCGEGKSTLNPMDIPSTERVITFLNCMPNGVQAMSADIEGLVQTSLNLGVLDTTELAMKAAFSIRSCISSQKEMMTMKVACLTEQLGGSVTVTGDYPGWAYQQESPLRDLMVEVFTEQYGYAPKIEAIHAGLECGLFSGKMPGLDCISLGPDLRGVHTCQEKMYIGSVQRVWETLVETLKRMKK